MTNISVGSVSVDVVPDATRFATDLKAKLRGVSVDVGVTPDLTDFRAKLDEATRERTATINVDAKTAGANAKIDEAARDRTANIKVKADKSALGQLGSLLNPGRSGLLPSLALGLGPALIPMAGAVAGLGAALAAPVAAAGGGLTIGGIVAGAAVKRTKEQIKQIAELKKKMDAAKLAAQQTNASVGVSAANSNAGARQSAANSLASAKTAHDTSVSAARAALASATTAAGRAAAQRRIDAANATYASRQAAIQANLSAHTASVSASAGARQAAAQKKVNEATKAYRDALGALSPAQKKFMDAQGRLKGSFQHLIQVAGPSILGPISTGMDTLAKILPKLKPLLDGVGGAINGVLDDIGKFAKSPDFKAFMTGFGDAAGKAITGFWGIFKNFGTGLIDLFRALSPLSGGFMKALDGMSGSFAKWASTLDTNKGFQKFVSYVRDIGPKVASTLGNLAGAVGKLVSGLAPFGGVVLGAIDGFAKFIRKADPGTLTAVGVAIGGIALALGKGPLGLAFSLGATLSHSTRFVNFLKKAGDLASTFADAFNKLPDAVKIAAAAVVGVGAIAAKLKGSSGLLGGKGGGGILGAVTGGFSKMKPIPVFVVNDPGSGPGGYKGFKGALKNWGPAAAVAATVAATGVETFDKQDSLHRFNATNTARPTSLAQLQQALQDSNLGKRAGDFGINIDRLARSLYFYGKNGKYAQEVIKKLDGTGRGFSGFLQGAASEVLPFWTGKVEKASEASHDLAVILKNNNDMLGHGKTAFRNISDGAQTFHDKIKNPFKISVVDDELKSSLQRTQAYRDTLKAVDKIDPLVTYKTLGLKDSQKALDKYIRTLATLDPRGRRTFQAQTFAKAGYAPKGGLQPGNNANGTDNWRGGWSWVGERGPELLNLPQGTRVMSHEKSVAAVNGGGAHSIAGALELRNGVAYITGVTRRDQQAEAHRRASKAGGGGVNVW